MTEPAFEIVRLGERSEGIAQGIDRAHLARLQRGETEVERRVDLHGLTASEAKRRLVTELEAAYAHGERCVLVIHGRGLRSEAGPVLRASLPEWLTTGRPAALVMAFASALPRDGGPGASYVLLRRARRG